jgi:WD40 repeat protein
VLSGSEDKQVILWNVKNKKGTRFDEHINWVTKVKLLDEYAVSGGSDRSVWVRDLNNLEAKSHGYKHEGYITNLEKLDETRIVTSCEKGQLVAYD